MISEPVNIISELANIPNSGIVVFMSARVTKIKGRPSLDAEIGRRVHQLMWDRHITQTDLGQRIDMDPSSIAKRLRGKLGWSASQVADAAEAIDTSIAYLMGETDDATPPNRPSGRAVGRMGLEPMTGGLWVAPVTPLFAA